LETLQINGSPFNSKVETIAKDKTNIVLGSGNYKIDYKKQ